MPRSRPGGATNRVGVRSNVVPISATATAGSIGTENASTAILTVHVVALVVGGGLAIAHDRGTLRASQAVAGEPAAAARRSALAELGAVHRIVGSALAISIATGAALFFLHTERYVTSALFWIKMALVIGLAANALVMQIAERTIREAGDGETAWRRLAGTAKVSSALWILVAVLGTILGQAR